MKRVLALQHCWDDPPGYLGEILQEHDIYCETIKVEEACVPVCFGLAPRPQPSSFSREIFQDNLKGRPGNVN